MIPIPTIIWQLEQYRAARLRADLILCPVGRVLARRMGLTLPELKGHIAAGEIQTVPGERGSPAVEEGEVFRFLQGLGEQGFYG